MALLLVGLVWIFSLTQTIVTPVITAAVVAAVASPLVRLARSPPRAPSGGAALLLLAIIALCGLVVVLVVGGITSQAGDLSGRLSDAKHTIQGWLTDLGVDPTKAHGATQDAGSSSSSAVKALLDGLGSGITALSSLIFFLSLTALSLFFLLRDGPAIRAWGERHLGVPMPVARTICQRSLESLRGYFLGVTLVAAFNAVVVWWARWSSAFRSRGRSPRSHSSPDTFLTLERGPRGRSPSWWRWAAPEPTRRLAWSWCSCSRTERFSRSCSRSPWAPPSASTRSPCSSSRSPPAASSVPSA